MKSPAEPRKNSKGDLGNVTIQCLSCDREFASEHGMKVHHAKVHGESIAGHLTTCEVCDDRFRYEKGAEKGRFCSQSCYSQWLTENSHRDLNPNWAGRIELTCEKCGSLFEVQPYRKESAKYCSAECRGDPPNFAGEDHPLWNGGRPDYGEGWNDAKKEAVRERDGYECQSCGLSQQEHCEQFDRKLDVHHITPAGLVSDPEERNSMENLIALCIPCHHEWERTAPLRSGTAEPAD